MTMTVAARCACATGEALALLVAEAAGELLERGRHRGELLGIEGAGDLRADLLDGGGQARLRGGAFCGERPAVRAGLDPAEGGQVVHLPVREIPAERHGAVDGVEDPPVAAGDPLVLEGGGELGRQQAVDGGDPEAERAALVGGRVLWGVVCAVHAKSFRYRGDDGGSSRWRPSLRVLLGFMSSAMYMQCDMQLGSMSSRM
jgi:hypothetical protein